jgi:hypothetical protein
MYSRVGPTVVGAHCLSPLLAVLCHHVCCSDSLPAEHTLRLYLAVQG